MGEKWYNKMCWTIFLVSTVELYVPHVVRSGTAISSGFKQSGLTKVLHTTLAHGNNKMENVEKVTVIKFEKAEREQDEIKPINKISSRKK